MSDSNKFDALDMFKEMRSSSKEEQDLFENMLKDMSTPLSPQNLVFQRQEGYEFATETIRRKESLMERLKGL